MKENINNRVNMYYGASSIIFDHAKTLRANMTQYEKLLWFHLRNKKLGVKFRRQHPIEKFIVDFYSHECLLAVEIDGKIHLNNKEYDEMRTHMLNHWGIKVIRFTNSQVLEQIEEVLSQIQFEISDRLDLKLNTHKEK